MLFKNLGFPADAGAQTGFIEADKMFVSSFSHGLQSNVLSFAVCLTPGADGAACADQEHLREGT